MVNHYTIRRILNRSASNIALTMLFLLISLPFAKAQTAPCPDPGGGVRYIALGTGSATQNFFPGAIPAGKTGSEKSTVGYLRTTDNMAASYTKRVRTIYPELPGSTGPGYVTLKFETLAMDAPNAEIKIYQGVDDTGTPDKVINSGSAASLEGTSASYTGPVTVTFESSIPAASGTFGIRIKFMTGDQLIATSCLGYSAAVWTAFMQPNSYTVIDALNDNVTNTGTPICIAYFNDNRKFVSSEVSYCADHDRHTVSYSTGHYPGRMIFNKQTNYDIDRSGTFDDVDRLKMARVVWILANAPTGVDRANLQSIEIAIWTTIGPNYQNNYGGLHSAAMAAVPDLPVPAEPDFSITAPATAPMAGAPTAFTVNFNLPAGYDPADYGTSAQQLKLIIPADVSVTSVTGNATYAGGILTFTSLPATVTVTVVSSKSQTASLKAVYEKSGFWNVQNLNVFSPCGNDDGTLQDFVGAHTAGDITYPYREASATWVAQPAFPCSELSYVIGNRNINGSNVSDAYTLDLSSGNTTLGKQTLIEGPNAFVNAIGYNIIDNYIWGFRYGTNQLVRIGSDWSVTFHNITGLPTPVPGFATGDVSPNGILYLYASNANQMTKIDLNPASANYLVAVTVPTTPTELNDWSFNPTNGLLYGFGTNKVLYQFDPTTGNRISLGAVTGAGIETSAYTGAFGTAFFDTDGDMYVGNNSSGAIFKISAPLTNLTASMFSTASGVTPGDGARCPSAIVTDPPVAVDDNGNTTCNAITIDVLANDVAGSAPLVASSVKLLTPGTLVRVTTLTVSGQGVYEVNPTTGAVTFTPENGLQNTVSVDYVVTDENGLESIATLTIVVNCPMPVTLVAFDARKEGRAALLTWSTTEEFNSNRFEIERSNNGKVWSLIGSVRSNGESNEKRNYSFVDPTPEHESLYRLKMVDNDGTFAYSRIRTLNWKGEVAGYVYPNPSTDRVYFDLSANKAIGKVQVVNTAGKIVLNTKPAASYLDVKALPAGMYVLKITFEDGSASSFKFLRGK